MILSDVRWAHPGGLLGPGKGIRTNMGRKGKVEETQTLGQPQLGHGKGSYHFIYWAFPFQYLT